MERTEKVWKVDVEETVWGLWGGLILEGPPARKTYPSQVGQYGQTSNKAIEAMNQLLANNVLLWYSVVFKTTAICAGVSINAEFIKRLNEQIPKTDREYFKLRPCTGLFEVGIPNELEMLEVQPLGRRKGKTHIVIRLWCKSQKSSRRLCKLADSDRLIMVVRLCLTSLLPMNLS